MYIHIKHPIDRNALETDFHKDKHFRRKDSTAFAYMDSPSICPHSRSKTYFTLKAILKTYALIGRGTFTLPDDVPGRS